MPRSDGWLEVGEQPFPDDDETIYVLSKLDKANVAVMRDGRPETWDLQCGSWTEYWPDDIILWRPMPDDWRDLIKEAKKETSDA